MLRELLNRSPDIWISDVESHFIPRFTRDDRPLRRPGRARELRSAGGGAARHARVLALGASRRPRRHGTLVAGCAAARLARRARRALPLRARAGDRRSRRGRGTRSSGATRRRSTWRSCRCSARCIRGARFVHLVRDPRDCVLSTQEAWGNTPLRTAQEWADRVRRCRTAGTALGPSRYLELRYEDLVGDVRGRLAASSTSSACRRPPTRASSCASPRTSAPRAAPVAS